MVYKYFKIATQETTTTTTTPTTLKNIGCFIG